MAGGSFHSGSSHSGSYHSSGGGSHSSGGGSHYSSGGSSHHSSGGGGGGGSGGSGGGSGTGSCLLVILFFLTPFLHLIIRFLFAVCNEEIAGFNEVIHSDGIDQCGRNYRKYRNDIPSGKMHG